MRRYIRDFNCSELPDLGETVHLMYHSTFRNYLYCLVVIQKLRWRTQAIVWSWCCLTSSTLGFRLHDDQILSVDRELHKFVPSWLKSLQLYQLCPPQRVASSLLLHDTVLSLNYLFCFLLDVRNIQGRNFFREKQAVQLVLKRRTFNMTREVTSLAFTRLLIYCCVRFLNCNHFGPVRVFECQMSLQRVTVGDAASGVILESIFEPSHKKSKGWSLMSWLRPQEKRRGVIQSLSFSSRSFGAVIPEDRIMLNAIIVPWLANFVRDKVSHKGIGDETLFKIQFRRSGVLILRAISEKRLYSLRNLSLVFPCLAWWKYWWDSGTTLPPGVRV